MKNNEKKLHEKLWASAQQLRASSLSSFSSSAIKKDGS